MSIFQTMDEIKTLCSEVLSEPYRYRPMNTRRMTEQTEQDWNFHTQERGE